MYSLGPNASLPFSSLWLKYDIYSGCYLKNRQFELSTGNDFDYWTETVSGSSTINVDTTNQFRGSQCCRFDIDASNSTASISQTMPIEVGQEYTLIFWAKSTGSHTSTLTIEGLFSAHTFTLQGFGVWRKYTYTFIAYGTEITIKNDSCADISFYIDEMSLIATPAKYSVLRGTLSSDSLSPDTAFTESGFGIPKAAIVIMSEANGTNNPSTSSIISIGFWDGQDQYCSWCSSKDAQSPTIPKRGISSGIIAKSATDVTNAEYIIKNTTDGVIVSLSNDNTSVDRYVTIILLNGAHVKTDIRTMIPNADDYTYETEIKFRPDLLLFASPCTASTFDVHGILSYGVATRYGTKNRSVIVADDNAQDPANNSSWVSTTECVAQVSSDSKTWGSTVTDFRWNGFALNTVGDPNGDKIMYLALKLPGVNVDVTTLKSPVSIGDQTVSGLGFKPSMLLSAHSNIVSTDTNSSGVSISFGAGTNNTESSQSITMDDNVSPSNTSSISDNKLINVYNNTVGTISNFNNDGVTLNYSKTNATYGWLVSFEEPNYNRMIETPNGYLLIKKMC